MKLFINRVTRKIDKVYMKRYSLFFLTIAEVDPQTMTTNSFWKTKIFKILDWIFYIGIWLISIWFMRGVIVEYYAQHSRFLPDIQYIQLQTWGVQNGLSMSVLFLTELLNLLLAPLVPYPTCNFTLKTTP